MTSTTLMPPSDLVSGVVVRELTRAGRLSEADLQRIDALRSQRRVQVGKLALRTRLLSPAQVATVLEHQATRDERFGVIAVELGFITEAEVQWLLAEQARMLPSPGELAIELGLVSREEWSHAAAVAEASGIFERADREVKCDGTGR